MHLGRRLARSEAMQRLLRAVGRTSPYTAIALTLPGGSLIALALWILDRRGSTAPLRRAVLLAAASAALVLPA